MPKSLLKQKKFSNRIRLNERVFVEPAEATGIVNGRQHENTYLIDIQRKEDFAPHTLTTHFDTELLKLLRVTKEDTVEKHSLGQYIKAYFHFNIVSTKDESDIRGHMIVRRFKAPGKKNEYAVSKLEVDKKTIVDFAAKGWH